MQCHIVELGIGQETLNFIVNVKRRERDVKEGLENTMDLKKMELTSDFERQSGSTPSISSSADNSTGFKIFRRAASCSVVQEEPLSSFKRTHVIRLVFRHSAICLYVSSSTERALSVENQLTIEYQLL